MKASSAGSQLSIDVTFDELGLGSAHPARTASRAAAPRDARWPLYACALCALVTAAVAFAESPLGQHPSVRPHTELVRAKALTGIGAVVDFAGGLTAR